MNFAQIQYLFPFDNNRNWFYNDAIVHTLEPGTNYILEWKLIPTESNPKIRPMDVWITIDNNQSNGSFTFCIYKTTTYMGVRYPDHGPSTKRQRKVNKGLQILQYNFCIKPKVTKIPVSIDPPIYICYRYWEGEIVYNSEKQYKHFGPKPYPDHNSYSVVRCTHFDLVSALSNLINLDLYTNVNEYMDEATIGFNCDYIVDNALP